MPVEKNMHKNFFITALLLLAGFLVSSEALAAGLTVGNNAQILALPHENLYYGVTSAANDKGNFLLFERGYGNVVFKIDYAGNITTNGNLLGSNSYWTASGNNLFATSTYNVGIGTANAGAYKLNVNGNTNITGTLNVTGALTTGGITGLTITAPNVSSGAFAANTGGGNFSFPGSLGIGTTPGVKLDVFGGPIRTNNQLISTVAAGTAPLAVTSNTLVANLNADYLDGYQYDDKQLYKYSKSLVIERDVVGKYVWVRLSADASLPFKTYMITGSWNNELSTLLVEVNNYTFNSSANIEIKAIRQNAFTFDEIRLTHGSTNYNRDVWLKIFLPALGSYGTNGTLTVDSNSPLDISSVTETEPISTIIGSYSGLRGKDTEHIVTGTSEFEKLISTGNTFLATLSGSVGIGTTNPGAYKLYVNGNTNINGTLTATNFSGAYSGTIGAANVSSGAFAANTGGGNFSFSGNLGVGTTNPLTNGGATSAMIHLNSAANTWSVFHSTNSTTGAAAGDGAIFGTIGNDAYVYNYEAGNLNFNTNGATGSMVLTSAGNLGIGTTIPVKKTQIESSAGGDGLWLKTPNPSLFLTDNTNADKSWAIYNQGGDNGLAFRAVPDTLIGFDTVTPALFLQHSTGNVGIGTTNPGAMLHLKVNGSKPYLALETSGDNDLWALSPKNSYDLGLDSYWEGIGGGITTANVIYFKNDGNVGIGTAAPGAYKLYVNGNTNINGTLNATTYTGGSMTGTVTAGNVSAGTFAANTGGGNFSFPGNVGIGITASGAKLEIDSVGAVYSGNPTLLLKDTTSRATLTMHSATDNNTPSDIFTKIGTKWAWSQTVRGDNENRMMSFVGADDAGTGWNAAGPVLALQRDGRVGIGITDPGSYKLYVNGTTNIASTLTASGGANIVGNLVMSGTANITGINKISVNTVDPLYNIHGTNYASFAASVVGGVKEEVTGKVAIEDKVGSEYQTVINFDKQTIGSDLWVWHNVIDFNKDNVEALITPYGGFANTYYYISGNSIVFKSDRPTEISYRLIAKRFDWKQWPTLPADQTEKAGLIIK